MSGTQHPVWNAPGGGEGPVRVIRLDGGTIHSREDLYNRLQAELDLPVWFGRNLDALHDCLTGYYPPTDLHVDAPALLEAALWPYAEKFRAVLRDAAAENPRLRVFYGSEEL